MYYQFDGTFGGYLTCVFEAFSRKEFDVQPVLPSDETGMLFESTYVVHTDDVKAERVFKRLVELVGEEKAKGFWKVFLSEDRQAWRASLKVLEVIFKGQVHQLENFGDSSVLYHAQTLKKVDRERHRIKAFVRFQKSEDGLYVATVEPDFNVLPLISPFFMNRYADQDWMIYDLKRNYGLIYRQNLVEEVYMDSSENTTDNSANVTLSFDAKESHYQQLWKRYFLSTNIVERKNMKLHLRHVPKRYWHLLIEKQPMN